MDQLNNNQVLVTIAQTLIKAREECGMKQEAAAKALQLSRSTLSKYENGDLSGLTIETLLAVSKLYGKPVMAFFPSEPVVHFNLILPMRHQTTAISRHIYSIIIQTDIRS